MLTQCPHCQATFRVNDTQLSAAGGKVRCGSCMKVFNANDHLVESAKDAGIPKLESVASPSPPKPASAVPASRDLFSKAMEKKQDAPDEDNLLFQDDPHEDQQENGYSGNLVSDSLLSDSFRELDSAKGSNSAFEDDLVEQEPLSADESWAESMLNDLEATRRQAAAASAQSSKRDPDSAAQRENRRQNPSNPLQTDFSLQAEPGVSALRADPKPGYGNFKAPPIRPFQEPAPSSALHLVGRLILVVLIVILLITLIGQLGLYHFDKLARIDWIRPAYVNVCSLLRPYTGCQLPDLRDISLIRSEDLVVRSHPLTKDALIIDAVLVNGATFEQPFPAINLSFSDINNAVVAQRAFMPTEYLSEEASQLQIMPSQTPVHISLELKDPGKQAVNYTISFTEAGSITPAKSQ